MQVVNKNFKIYELAYSESIESLSKVLIPLKK